MKIIYVVFFTLIIVIFQLLYLYINKLIVSYNPKLTYFFSISLMCIFRLIALMNKPTKSGIIIVEDLNQPLRQPYKRIRPV